MEGSRVITSGYTAQKMGFKKEEEEKKPSSNSRKTRVSLLINFLKKFCGQKVEQAIVSVSK